MTLGLLGHKIGMTQVYDETGKIFPVTVLQLGPCPVLLVRNQDRDGYDAVQVGLGEKLRHKATRAERGHVSEDMESKRRQAGSNPLAPKANIEPPRFIREFRLEQAADIEVGKVLTVSEIFSEVQAVDVIGTSKGRGYTGAMKRWNYAGKPASHGAKKVHRQVGSTSSNASNRGGGRPKKGIRAAGQHGNQRRTARNLKVVRVDAENNILLVRGGIPGPNGGFVMVQPTNKKG
jgi:large subunit ribosomal protein L3